MRDVTILVMGDWLVDGVSAWCLVLTCCLSVDVRAKQADVVVV